MYWDDHSPPHFHAKYGEYEITVSITTGSPFTVKIALFEARNQLTAKAGLCSLDFNERRFSYAA